MALDTATQLQTINGTTFYTDLRNALKTIFDFFATNTCTLEGSLVLVVDQIEVVCTPSGNGIAKIACGVDTNGQPLFEWNAPMGWIS